MSRVRDQSGFALLTTMGVLILMLSMAMTLASIVDTQTGASGAQRQRDSVFNLAESVLTAQVFSLSRDWPGAGRSAERYEPCTEASATSRCPEATVLQGASSDVQAGATWQTSVHDNDASGGKAFYSDALIMPRPGYDANRDGRVWVRASASARGRTRTLVALVGAEQQEEPVPNAALVAARLEITNNGNKTLIAANGGLMAVRCSPQLIDLTPCLGHKFGLGKYASLTDLLGFLATQISGATPVTGYGGGGAMTAESRARLRATAIANGTYYTGCPTETQLTGQVVYVEGGNCSYTSNTQFNSPTAPGMLLMNSGSVSFGGTSNFHGVVYAANAANASGWAVQTSGNAVVTGGVLVDGDATMVAGSSGLNIVFDPNAYRAVASYGSAGVVQNTWREIRAG
ncbi:MAG: hypothetical protein WKF94_19445 [Solirubrobacteraceae bacterium]